MNQNINEAYNIFIQKALLLYDHYISEKEIKVIKKVLKSPQTTTGIKKSSKREQRLQEISLKNPNSLSESRVQKLDKII